MKKDLAIIGGLFILIVAILVFGQGFTSVSFGTPTQSIIGQRSAAPTKMNVSVRSLNVEAEVASTANLRKKGLGKRDSLPFDKGVIFVFEKSGQYGIWMKDMKFAIDIIWIDENKRIVNIGKNIPPEPGKKDSQLTVYKPQNDAKYILEVNAGLSDLHGLIPGDQVNF